MKAMSRPAESTSKVIDPRSFDPETRSRGHWVIVFNPQPRPHMRLVCFPYAGGDAKIFRDWAVAMSEGVEVIGLLYPGCGCNQYPPPISNCDEMAVQLGAVVAPFLGIERVQEQLAELWKEVLAINQVGHHDNSSSWAGTRFRRSCCSTRLPANSRKQSASRSSRRHPPSARLPYISKARPKRCRQASNRIVWAGTRAHGE